MLLFKWNVKDERTIKCSKCGAVFSCNPQGNCWCGNLQLSKEQLKTLKLKYKDCLCENCISIITKSY
jgi:hypothetical protein